MDFINELRTELYNEKNGFGAPLYSTEDLYHELEEARRDSLTDPLTDMPNRRRFVSELTRSVSSFERHNIPFSLLSIDLKKFKEINDTEGHLVGDEVLKMIGEFLKLHSRPTDIPCRLGGDEFIIILNETNQQGAQSLLELLLNSVESGETTLKSTNENDIKVNFRASVLEWKKDNKIVEFLSTLDKDMYERERDK